jgi:hypothetical protein
MNQMLFLEAADSVRSGYNPTDSVDLPSPAQARQYRHLGLETLVRLAFGADLVISQSYAIDSYAQQEVLRDLSIAYAGVSRDLPSEERYGPAPARIHLFGVDPEVGTPIRTFRQASAAIFRA